MTCGCCLSDIIEPNPFGLENYSRCGKCGFIFLSIGSIEKSLEQVSQHYQCQDPHKKVARLKASLYNFVLNYLDFRIRNNRKKILDLGCGYGYFLNMASKRGWQPNGIELVQDAVKICREERGYKNVYQAKLKDTRLSERSFDAITLWDVLAIVDDPYNELKECKRLLKKGGIIGIRTRNVLFQSFVYRMFNLIKRIAVKVNLKEPYVFNKYCFSEKSLYTLLSRLGFINIEITNSPLTSGDPYDHMPFSITVRLAKICINIFSKFVFWMTHGRWLTAPSILIWAEKP